MQNTSIQGMKVNNSNPFLSQILDALDLLFDGPDGPARVQEVFQAMELSHGSDPELRSLTDRKSFRERLFEMQMLRNALMSMGHAYIMLLEMRNIPPERIEKAPHFTELLNKMFPTNEKESSPAGKKAVATH